jgi:D-lactate dehydrogenase (quinone)
VYTERVLYARVDGDGRVRVVDTLGLALPPGLPSVVKLLSDPAGAPIALDPAAGERKSHDTAYAARLCSLDGSVARCNADTHGPDAVRSEGKVLVLASIHSTFPKPLRSDTLWVSCDDFETAHRIRARCLRDPAALPSQLEYLDAGSYAVIDRSGRALCLAIRAVGIGERLRQMWDVKLWFEARTGLYRLVDWLLHWANPVLPAALPPRVAALGARYGHHLIVTLDSYGGDADAATAALKADVLALAAAGGRGCAHECDAGEAALVKTFRFAAAPAFRTFCVGTGAAAGLSFDYSLPKNYTGVPDVARGGSVIAQRMRYSHFGCAVVHEDIAYGALAGTPEEEKYAVKHVVEGLGGRLPAEHGHGVEYAAPPEVVARWERADPTNCMNPGIGRTSTRPGYDHDTPPRL